MYYVFFDAPRSKARLTQRMLKREFSHCFAVTEQEGGCMLINPGPRGIYIESFKGDFDVIIEAYVNDTQRCVAYWAEYAKPSAWYRPYGLYNCVSILKRMLFIDSFAITPYQLYKSLMYNDGILIK